MRPPTDLELLEAIYDLYYEEFSSHSKASPTRLTKNYVHIDIATLGRRFSVDPDIIFGRLYYHLDPKYRFTQSDGSKVPFFEPFELHERHAVHFPLLASVVATLRDERNKHLWTTWLSALSLVVSIIALVVSVAAKGAA